MKSQRHALLQDAPSSKAIMTATRASIVKLFPAPPAVGLTPGASWQRNGAWWYWRYPRCDLDVVGCVFDDATWQVLVEEVELFHSKVPARSLGTAGHQCWRAMCRASTWNAPRMWREQCALAHLGAGLASVCNREKR